MLKFKKNRSVDEIEKLLQKRLGFEDVMDRSNYDRGGDTISFLWYIDLETIEESERYGSVVFNTFHGWFTLYTASGVSLATHLSSHLDSKGYYKDLLKTVYKQRKEEEKQNDKV